MTWIIFSRESSRSSGMFWASESPLLDTHRWFANWGGRPAWSLKISQRKETLSRKRRFRTCDRRTEAFLGPCQPLFFLMTMISMFKFALFLFIQDQQFSLYINCLWNNFEVFKIYLSRMTASNSEFHLFPLVCLIWIRYHHAMEVNL